MLKKNLEALVGAVILIWIYERYGDFYEELKPPSGFSPYVQTSWHKRLLYQLKYLLWEVECSAYYWVRSRIKKIESAEVEDDSSFVNPFDVFSLIYSSWKYIFEESLLSVESRRTYFFAALNNDLFELRDALMAELERTSNFDVYNNLPLKGEVDNSPLTIFIEKFLAHLPRHFHEAGFESALDVFVEKQVELYKSRVYLWLWYLYVDNNYKNAHLAIVETLSHQDKYISDHALDIAEIALRSDDAEHQEAGLRCIENWEKPSSLKVLRNSGPLKYYYLEEHRLSLIEQLELQRLEYD